MRIRTLTLSVSLVMSALLAAGCTSRDDDNQVTAGRADLTVELRNWAIVPSTTEVRAGLIKVAAVHPTDHGAHSSGGGEVHQLVIARLKLGAKDGDGAYEKLLLNLSDIEMGKTKTGEVRLEPGQYELACLLVEEAGGKTYNHYEEGMHTTLKVM